MPESNDYIAQLRSALAHLHDPVRLENHPLASRIAAVAQAPDLSRGQLLRRTLQLAIEALNPGPGFSVTSREARGYRLLRARYILGEEMGQAAAQLGIGQRQAQRELLHALEALARILQAPANPTCSDAAKATEGLHISPAARVQAEIGRLAELCGEDVDAVQLVKDVVAKARRLAQQWHAEIDLQVQSESLNITGNRVMLRQALLNLLSHLTRTQQGRQVNVRLAQATGTAVIRISYPGPAPAIDLDDPDQPYAVAIQLLRTLGLDWEHCQAPSGAWLFTLHVPLARKHSILIVDDNPGLIRLFERYLSGRPYTVHSASSVDEALRMLPQVQPDVVILDVMIPKRDGWDLLETLRAGESDRQVRVLVCSVINDPHLAAALGADGFLHKPVDQMGLLQALDRVLPT